MVCVTQGKAGWAQGRMVSTGAGGDTPCISPRPPSWGRPGWRDGMGLARGTLGSCHRGSLNCGGLCAFIDFDDSKVGARTEVREGGHVGGHACGLTRR